MPRGVSTRTKEERIEIIDTKIKYHKECIDTLEEKKSRLLNPTRKKSESSLLMDVIKAKGLSIEEALAKLG